MRIVTLFLITVGIISFFLLKEEYSKEYLYEFSHIILSKKDFFKAKISIPWWVDINIQDNIGYTFLHYSVEQNNIPMVKYLLESGADPNIQTYSGKTPMHLAAMYGELTNIKMLNQAGANVNIFDIYHKTPVFYGVEIGSLKTMLLLEKFGAKLNIVDNTSKNLMDRALGHQYKNIVLNLIGKIGLNGREEKVTQFLDFWKEQYNKLFNIQPVFDYGIQEVSLARFNILSFEQVDINAIQRYLYKRQLRKNPNAKFQGNILALFS